MNAINLSDICFHDATILRVVELPQTSKLLFYVDYPVDWENDIFKPRVIAFRGVMEYRVDEGWCEGCPVLLGYDEFAGRNGWKGVILNTSHGTRRFLFREVELRTAPEGSE